MGRHGYWRGVALVAAVLTLTGCAFVERVDVASDGTSPALAESSGYLSRDGRFEAFVAFTPLVAGDENGEGDVYVRDVRQDTTERVSVSTTGGDPDDRSGPFGISADGRYVLFISWATNLVPGGTSGTNLFVRDRTAGTTTLVTVTTDGQAPNAAIGRANLSADGHTVAFDTPATNIASGAVANRGDVYARDLVAGTTSRVSLNTSGAAANSDSQVGGVSGDGNLVVFESTGSNLGGGSAYNRTYVRDRSAGTTTLVDVPLSGSVNRGALPADDAISTNGRYVLFVSWSDNLTADDPVGTTDVYVRDLVMQSTSLVTAPTGIPSTGDAPPLVALNAVGISDDGRYVLVNGLRTGNIQNLTDLQTYVIDRAEPRITLIRADERPAVHAAGARDLDQHRRCLPHVRHERPASDGFVHPLHRDTGRRLREPGVGRARQHSPARYHGLASQPRHRVRLWLRGHDDSGLDHRRTPRDRLDHGGSDRERRAAEPRHRGRGNRRRSRHRRGRHPGQRADRVLTPEATRSTPTTWLGFGRGATLPPVEGSRRLLAHPAQLTFQHLDARLELHDPSHPGETDALIGELLDSAEQNDVAFGIPSTAALGARRFDQSLAFVDPQRLGMHTGEIRGNRDDVEGTFVVGHHTPKSARGSSEKTAASASIASRCS